MKSKIVFLALGLAPILAGTVCAQTGTAEIDRRVDSLLSQMTLDEKVGQMTQVDVNALADRADIQKYFLGSLLNGGGGGPTNNVPENWRRVVDGYQSWALKTRLKIPLIYG